MRPGKQSFPHARDRRDFVLGCRLFAFSQRTNALLGWNKNKDGCGLNIAISIIFTPAAARYTLCIKD